MTIALSPRMPPNAQSRAIYDARGGGTHSDDESDSSSSDDSTPPAKQTSSSIGAAGPAASKDNIRTPPQPDHQQDEPSSSRAPGSSQGNAQTTIPKDRPCPFCHQLFTSSSLGRHLDLYIRPRNPKPPDGIHDVDKIRKIRAGITRRQARSSHASRSGGASGEGGHRRDSRSGTSSPDQSGEHVDSNRRAPPAQPMRFSNSFNILNKADWTATGVINNLPPRALTAPTASTEGRPPDHAGPPSPNPQRADYGVVSMGPFVVGVRSGGSRPDASPLPAHASSASQLPPVSSSGRGGQQQQQQQQPPPPSLPQPPSAHVSHGSADPQASAAEKALRAVLETLRTAVARAYKTQLFDFDVFSQNFPGLCLRLLPQPNALYSSTPATESFERGHCSLGPPGAAQYDSLKRTFIERIDQSNSQILQQLHWSSINPPEANVSMSDAEQARYFDHLADSFAHWNSLSDHQRLESWQIELHRAYNQERERRERAEWSYDGIREDWNNLNAENNAASKLAFGHGASQHQSSSPSPGPPKYAPIQRQYSASSASGPASGPMVGNPPPPPPSGHRRRSTSQQLPPMIPPLRESRYSAGSILPQHSRESVRRLPLHVLEEFARMKGEIREWDYDSLVQRFAGPMANPVTVEYYPSPRMSERLQPPLHSAGGHSVMSSPGMQRAGSIGDAASALTSLTRRSSGYTIDPYTRQPKRQRTDEESQARSSRDSDSNVTNEHEGSGDNSRDDGDEELPMGEERDSRHGSGSGSGSGGYPKTTMPLHQRTYTSNRWTDSGLYYPPQQYTSSPQGAGYAQPPPQPQPPQNQNLLTLPPLSAALGAPASASLTAPVAYRSRSSSSSTNPSAMVDVQPSHRLSSSSNPGVGADNPGSRS